MSLLEGHASFVMNEVARDHVADVDRMRRALAARRRSNAAERTLQRAIGFDQKIKQYDSGERFVREIVARARHGHVQPGVELAPSTSPPSRRSPSPQRWLARLGA